jgi:hypothetical protein
MRLIKQMKLLLSKNTMFYCKNNLLSIHFLILILFTFCSCSTNNKDEPLIDESKNKPVFTSKIISLSDSTYGYGIYKNNTLYIRQLNIPAVSGNHQFKTEFQAQKVAELVILKLKSNIIPPSISIFELDSLKILYKSN